MKNKLILTVLAAFVVTASFGQMYPERSSIRSGNKAYGKENYEESEIRYLDALKKNPYSFEGNFNLSDVHYKQGRYEEAQVRLEQLVGHPEAAPEEIAKAYYNLGNALFQQDKLEEALEAYKNSLRINPSDEEAKFNLAYTKKLLENDNDENDDNDGDGEGDGDQDNDPNDDPDGDDDSDDPNNDPDGEDENENEDDPDDNEGDGDQDNDDRESPSQESEGGMNREEAERMLDAVQNSEDRTRDRMDEEKAATVVAPSGKNW